MAFPVPCLSFSKLSLFFYLYPLLCNPSSLLPPLTDVCLILRLREEYPSYSRHILSTLAMLPEREEGHGGEGETMFVLTQKPGMRSLDLGNLFPT